MEANFINVSSMHKLLAVLTVISKHDQLAIYFTLSLQAECSVYGLKRTSLMWTY